MTVNTRMKAGVDDHLFFTICFASKLKTFATTVLPSLLTLSLHHPFPVPEPYKTSLDSIKTCEKKY